MNRIDTPWLKGTFTALITPMDETEGVDFYSLERLLEYQIQYADGIVSCGTTAQSPTLSVREEDQINSLVSKVSFPYYKPVIVGAGSNDTSHALRATKRAIGSGANGALHVMGYYNKPSQEGVIKYFSEVAAVDNNFPIIIYNIPGRGAADIRPETMIYLAEKFRNIVGVKESNSSRATAQRARELSTKHQVPFIIMSGDDDQTLSLMKDESVQASGGISVMSNILPYSYSLMTISLGLNDNLAERINSDLTILNKIVGMTGKTHLVIGGKEYCFDDIHRNPVLVNSIAYMLGMIKTPLVRSPLVQLPADEYYRVGQALAGMYEANPEQFRPLEEHFNVKVSDRLSKYFLEK